MQCVVRFELFVAVQGPPDQVTESGNSEPEEQEITGQVYPSNLLP